VEVEAVTTLPDCNDGDPLLQVRALVFADPDGDSYGSGVGTEGCTAGALAQGTAGNGLDCSELSANAMPEQAVGFSVDRGDGSFDYDCDGVETPIGTTAVTGCTASTDGLSCLTNGFTTVSAGCGDPLVFASSCPAAPPCTPLTASTTSRCR
jgi:hypothetical protein